MKTIQELESEVAEQTERADRLQAEVERFKKPSVDEGSLNGLKIEYNETDNRFTVHAADGSFLWSGDAFFNAWKCARLTAELAAVRRARDCWEDNFKVTNASNTALKSALLEVEELINEIDTHAGGLYGSSAALERIKELRKNL